MNQYGLIFNVNPTAQSKIYDGTTAATVTGGTLSATVNGDVITANTGTFANAGPGIGIAVTVKLSGAAAGNAAG